MKVIAPMKTAIVYNKNDHKLQASAYSWSYRSMFLALFDKLQAQPINDSCSAVDIDADLIIFFDPHSSHHIKIDGLKQHPAVKMEFFNDPHQAGFRGRYKDGTPVHKLSVRERVARAKVRGIEYIICPYKSGYYKYIAPFLGKDADRMLLYFPMAPDASLFESGGRRLIGRQQDILANGCTWAGTAGATLGCYEFRRWAYNQPCVKFVDHVIKDKETPSGCEFGNFLSQYIGALALCEFYPIPKYFEIPLSGCVTLAQHHDEYYDLGFRDNENCIYVDKDNFYSKVNDLLHSPESYQQMADAGRRLVLSKYTARHFAEYIYSFAKSVTRDREAVGV